MPYQLTFNSRYEYSSFDEGITVEMALGLGEHIAACQAKVDPGAQVCLFQREIGERLGLDIEQGSRKILKTLAGSLIAYGHSVTLYTLGVEFDSVVYFAADSGLSRNLLGREGWLLKVRLALVDYDSTLYLSPYQNQE